MDLKCGYLTLLFDQGSEVSCQCRDTSGSDKTLANGRSFPIMLQLQQRRDLNLQVKSKWQNNDNSEIKSYKIGTVCSSGDKVSTRIPTDEILDG